MPYLYCEMPIVAVDVIFLTESKGSLMTYEVKPHLKIFYPFSFMLCFHGFFSVVAILSFLDLVQCMDHEKEDPDLAMTPYKDTCPQDFDVIKG